MERSGAIQGRLRLEVRNLDGQCVAVRRAGNIVLRSGAELLAALLAGSAATPLNGVAVGVNSQPSSPPYADTGLTVNAPDGTPIIQLVTGSIDAGSVTATVIEDQLKMRLSLRTIMGPNRAVSPDAAVRTVNIGEAALGVLAADGDSLARIYNRVVFEPVPKARDQELALYWEIDFPYGV